MHYTYSRKLLALSVAAAMLWAVAAPTYAADVVLQASLFGQRGDQDATGRALWTMDRDTGESMLVMRVVNVSSSELLMAFVDGQFIGTIEINNESGRLVVQDSSEDGSGLEIQPGSIIDIYRSEDGVQVLFGEFGQR